MSQLESARPALERLCGSAVDLLLARHEWRLLDRAEFIRRALLHLSDGVAGDAQRAATYAYSQALYMACSGAEGFERQNRAYTELFRYLYDSALHRYPDVYDEAAQHALARTFARFERCRQPGAFLAFAFQQLADSVRTLRREAWRPRSLTAPAGARDAPLADLLADTRQPDPSEAVIAAELHARFEQLADEFLRKHPRAAQQFAALRLKFIAGLDDTTIARRLGKSVKSVHVLRSRAIEKLRAEPAWRALAVEFGILPDE
jgi:RNA polymerase sigma factor (sigma-70 family)